MLAGGGKEVVHGHHALHLSGVFTARQSIRGHQGEVHRVAASRFLDESGNLVPQLGIFTRFSKINARYFAAIGCFWAFAAK